MTANTFTKFRNSYKPDPFAKRPSTYSTPKELGKLVGGRATGYSEFLRLVACTSLTGGLLRFLIPDDSLPLSLTSWNSPNGWSRSWTRYEKRLFVFAYDWLGRQIAFDRKRVISDELMVAMLEPGTGELLEVPANFVQFIEEELIQHDDAALASSFYREWRSSGGQVPKPHQCVGYRIPMFLGGADAVDNLEIIDLDVYVTITGQLFEGTLSLLPGQKISEISIR
jgi:hypothetical protein